MEFGNFFYFVNSINALPYSSTNQNISNLMMDLYFIRLYFTYILWYFINFHFIMTVKYNKGCCDRISVGFTTTVVPMQSTYHH